MVFVKNGFRAVFFLIWATAKTYMKDLDFVSIDEQQVRESIVQLERQIDLREPTFFDVSYWSWLQILNFLCNHSEIYHYM